MPSLPDLGLEHRHALEDDDPAERRLEAGVQEGRQTGADAAHGSCTASAAAMTAETTSASTASYTARNSASLPLKWWYSAPFATPARWTMSSIEVAA